MLSDASSHSTGTATETRAVGCFIGRVLVWLQHGLSRRPRRSLQELIARCEDLCGIVSHPEGPKAKGQLLHGFRQPAEVVEEVLLQPTWKGLGFRV